MQESEFEAFRNERLRSINVLPDEQRDAILYLLGGLPIDSSDPEVDTIARRQGVDESTVRYRIKRGVARLNEPLGENQ
jgi:DNA-directed RNA polymerase specialized sigma24 family protein